MDVAGQLRRARLAAGLTQRQLAARAGTSQAAVSVYESGQKRPAAATFARLVEAADARLAVQPAGALGAEAWRRRHERSARVLAEVLALAEALPSRPGRRLRYPRLVPRR